MNDEWVEAADWWSAEVADDSIFDSDVAPLLDAMVADWAGRWLDLGCGEGRALRLRGPGVFGCDLSLGLLRTAREVAPVVQCRLPELGWLRPGSLDGAYAVLVFEHLADLEATFAAVHRVVRPGGALVVVANHPAFTAAGSGPIVDVDDGEVLWRWGPYLEAARTATDVGGRIVTFHHRPIGAWLSTAARAGWRLESMTERALGAEAIAAYPGYAGQEELPVPRWMALEALKRRTFGAGDPYTDGMGRATVICVVGGHVGGRGEFYPWGAMR